MECPCSNKAAFNSTAPTMLSLTSSPLMHSGCHVYHLQNTTVTHSGYSIRTYQIPHLTHQEGHGSKLMGIPPPAGSPLSKLTSITYNLHHWPPGLELPPQQHSWRIFTRIAVVREGTLPSLCKVHDGRAINTVLPSDTHQINED